MASSVFRADPWSLLPNRVLRREWVATLAGAALLTGALAAQGGLPGFDRTCYDAWLSLSASDARADLVLIDLQSPKAAPEATLGAAAMLLERLAGVPVRAVGLALPYGAFGATEDSAAADRLSRLIEESRRVVVAVPPEPPAGAGGRGFRDFREDEDGVLRHVALARASPGAPATEEHWVVAALRAAHVPFGLPARGTPVSDPVTGRDFTAQIGIPFSHPATRPYPLYGSEAVLAGAVPLENFRNKFVLIASAAGGPPGRIPIPGEGILGAPQAAAALQIEAQLLAGLLEGHAITTPGPLAQILFSVVPVALALLALLLPLRGAGSTLALTGLTLVLSYVMLAAAHVWFAPGAGVLGAALCLPVWRWRELRITSVLLDRQFARLAAEAESFAERNLPAEGGPTPDRWRFVAAARSVDRIRELRRFLGRFVDELGVATLVTDLDGHVIFANRRARQYFAALGNTQIDGAQLPYLLSTLEADQVAADFSWWDILGRTETPTRAAGCDPLGREVLVWASGWSGLAGDPAGWVASLVEISGIRAAERTRDAALHFMTGELCAPVQGVLALTAEAREGGSTPELLEAIENHGQRTLELAEKFVQLTIAATHQYIFPVRPVHESVELAIDANEPFALGRNATLSLVKTGQPDFAEIDPDMFWRAVHTLIQNALRFGPDGGTVGIGVTLLADGREVGVRVNDQGPGIGGSDQARLVRMFQSIDMPGAHRGSGDLGLAFVKEVVERHHGRVEFSSNPGQGAEFWIILPCVEAPPPSGQRKVSPAPSRGAL